ncbi:MAG: cytochrome c maturation protein CcmE [Alphaproteobacteria bacterium]|nr:cytochrome c maturation protein CcmE [Alphaproteobacteria bacterium]
MTRKRRRLLFVLSGLIALGIAATLILTALEDNLVFFYSPSDLQIKAVQPTERIRVGGLVEEGSVKKNETGLEVTFRVTDLKHAITVHYRGPLPDLFREGQGIVAEGNLQTDGTFKASQVLAKHDENYMPPEVADALKRAGRWQEGKPE